ncbi:hypothetical protein SELMODRAFT_409427 [Selaginella moellendorffii]|uniref:F-box domain-containing protein n=1 Tax=Selaginella moellendorffii TaxID=88036 RepID=D8RBF1_SELML|nr:F-box/kelch-repeat protein SKIP25 [Selaginella moellendorffii]EFJ30784.1 hypothetical protein SELMODRAFT_409427 [Selaginella moellendorffii]|eukprot:XP_002968530.1 F-box/kelch-repeat protein SKIP25 [Selaginella moellendorffii]
MIPVEDGKECPPSKRPRPDRQGSSSILDPLLPGLPDDLALLCLARVDRISGLWGVARSWQRLLYDCPFFFPARAKLGLPGGFNWLYVLIASKNTKNSTGGAAAFQWYAFDPLAAKWHRLPPMPHDVRFELSRRGFLPGPYSLSSIQCASTSDKLIVVAGTRTAGADTQAAPSSSAATASVPRAPPGGMPPVEPALDSPLVFHVRTASWSRGPRYTVPRRWCSCGTTAGGQLLVASGCGNEWDLRTARQAEMWDTNGGAVAGWRAVQPLESSKLSREATPAVEFDGKLYMVSARSGLVLNPGSETWEPMPSGLTRGWNGPGVTSGGKLFVMDDTAGRIKAYDGGTESWVCVLEDKRLKNLRNVVAAHGKICGSVGGLIRVVDIGKSPVEFRDIEIPVEGQIMGLQILSKLEGSVEL